MLMSNLIGQRGPACRLSASQTQGLGMRLACLLNWSGSGMSGGPTAPWSSQCECLVLEERPY